MKTWDLMFYKSHNRVRVIRPAYPLNGVARVVVQREDNGRTVTVAAKFLAPVPHVCSGVMCPTCGELFREGSTLSRG